MTKERSEKVQRYLSIIVSTLVDACWYSKNEEIRPAPMVQAIRDYVVFLEEENAALKIEIFRVSREKEQETVRHLGYQAEREPQEWIDEELKSK